MNKTVEFPRIKDLPVEEQELFKEWLTGQTMPLADNYKEIPQEEWDWYYPWDYQRWKTCGG